MKPVDYIIIGIIVILVVIVTIIIIKNKKKGKCLGCGGDCNTCKFQKNKDEK